MNKRKGCSGQLSFEEKEIGDQHKRGDDKLKGFINPNLNLKSKKFKKGISITNIKLRRINLRGINKRNKRERDRENLVQEITITGFQMQNPPDSHQIQVQNRAQTNHNPLKIYKHTDYNRQQVQIKQDSTQFSNRVQNQTDLLHPKIDLH